MAERVAVDTDGVRSPTGRLAELGDRIANIGRHLTQRLEAYDDAFGDDKAGLKYRANYVEPRNQLLIGIPTLAGVIDKVATNLEIMSRTYEQTEDDATSQADRLRDAVPPGGTPSPDTSKPGPGGGNPRPPRT